MRRAVICSLIVQSSVNVQYITIRCNSALQSCVYVQNSILQYDSVVQRKSTVAYHAVYQYNVVPITVQVKTNAINV